MNISIKVLKTLNYTIFIFTCVFCWKLVYLTGDSIKESLAGENLPTKKSPGPPEEETGDNTEEKTFVFARPKCTSE